MRIRKDNVATIRIMVGGLVLWLAAAMPTATDLLADGTSTLRRGGSATAARQLIVLAERGNARAQAQLGFMYEYGRGVPQDFVIAAHWYRCAAEQGEPSAQYQLGLMYDKGHGVPRSVVIAYTWLNLAAARARPPARDYYLRIRDALASKLNNAQRDEAQRLASSWAPRR
jgi:TPR repeat protein